MALVRSRSFLWWRGGASGRGCTSISVSPTGFAMMTPAMRFKVELGNAMSGWLASFIREADRCGLVWWVENPAGSYLWHMPEWKSVLRDLECNFFCADYCRWGAPYRNRTRFLCNTTAAAERLLCNCSTPNLSLCAYSKVHGCSWTHGWAISYKSSVCPLFAVTGSVMHRIPGLDLEEMWDLSLLTWSSLTRFDLPPDCFKRVLWTSSTAGFADSCRQRSLRA